MYKRLKFSKVTVLSGVSLVLEVIRGTIHSPSSGITDRQLQKRHFHWHHRRHAQVHEFQKRCMIPSGDFNIRDVKKLLVPVIPQMCKMFRQLNTP